MTASTSILLNAATTASAVFLCGEMDMVIVVVFLPGKFDVSLTFCNPLLREGTSAYKLSAGWVLTVRARQDKSLVSRLSCSEVQ